MDSVLRTKRAVTRGGLALAALTAVVFAAGFRTEAAAAQSPVLSAGGPYYAYTGQVIQFTGAVDGASVASATWTFGDGTILDGLSVLKTFYASGIYTATLTVTDRAGVSTSATTTATIYASSTPTGILTPATLTSAFVLQSLFSPFVQLANGVILINGQLFTLQASSVCADPNYALTPFCQNL